MQNEFLDKYFNEFEDKNENKLIYTDIFKKYTQITESYIEENLIKRVPQYKIDDFYKQTFKEMMLDYKARKNHKKDLFNGINIEKVTKEKHGESMDNFEELKKKYNSKKK